MWAKKKRAKAKGEGLGLQRIESKFIRVQKKTRTYCDSRLGYSSGETAALIADFCSCCAAKT